MGRRGAATSCGKSARRRQIEVPIGMPLIGVRRSLPNRDRQGFLIAWISSRAKFGKADVTTPFPSTEKDLATENCWHAFSKVVGPGNTEASEALPEDESYRQRFEVRSSKI
jgi:hypothetical protein